MTFQFELGKPFRPFEQLMGVLPEASKELVPPPYRVSMVYFFREVVLYLSIQPLMSDFTSPIREFYPKDFEHDMNGKKQEWEAVVKIPFIDETRLLQAMACMFPSADLIFACRSSTVKPKSINSPRKNVDGTALEQVYLSPFILGLQPCIPPLSQGSSPHYTGASASWNPTISQLWTACIWCKVYAMASSLALNLWPVSLPSRQCITTQRSGVTGLISTEPKVGTNRWSSMSRTLVRMRNLKRLQRK
jgi:hypothetical protein